MLTGIWDEGKNLRPKATSTARRCSTSTDLCSCLESRNSLMNTTNGHSCEYWSISRMPTPRKHQLVRSNVRDIPSERQGR